MSGVTIVERDLDELRARSGGIQLGASMNAAGQAAGGSVARNSGRRPARAATAHRLQGE